MTGKSYWLLVNDPGEKEVVARGLDLAQVVLRTHSPQLSDFYQNAP